MSNYKNRLGRGLRMALGFWKISACAWLLYLGAFLPSLPFKECSMGWIARMLLHQKKRREKKDVKDPNL